MISCEAGRHKLTFVCSNAFHLNIETKWNIGFSIWKGEKQHLETNNKGP